MKNSTLFLLIIVLLISLVSCNKTSDENSSISNSYDDLWQETQDNINLKPVVKELDDKMKIRRINYVSFETDDTTNQISLSLLKDELNKNGISISEDAQTSIYLGSKRSDLPDGEGYIIDTTSLKIVLASKTTFGQFYAVQTFLKLLNGNMLSAATIIDTPDFPIRGVVEGFYGEPWSHQDRLSIIRFMGENRMNTYLYAPKDDDKIRLLWREAYIEDELNQLRQLQKTAQENSVRFVYSLSPGNDFNYSAGYENDLAILIEKYNILYNIGVRDFALLLDDIPFRNATLAANHVRLVNDFRQRFYSDKDDLSELICIFAEYLDTIVTEGYTNTITKSINPDVLVMWTGPNIDIHMNAKGFDFANKAYNRKMLLWWNYPCNDYVEGRLHAAAAQGLANNLNTAVQGVLSNPMNQAETSKTVLFTLAEYLWNSKAYKPTTSFNTAIQTIFPEVSDSVRYFFENTNASGINNYTDSIVFKKLISNFNTELKKNIKDGDAAKKLHDELKTLKTVVSDIKNNCKNKNFVDEIAPWLNKAEAAADMILIYLDAQKNNDEAAYWEYCRLFFELKQKYDLIPAKFSSGTLAPFVNANVFDGIKALRPDTLILQQKVTSSKFNNIEGKPTVSAALHWYDKYHTQYMLDDKDDTFYWSNNAAFKGFWIMLDLGKLQHIYNIKLKGGGAPSPNDYILKGQMQYSVDGSEWIDIGNVQTTKTVVLLDLDINCRYIRYVAVEAQENWVSATDFCVNFSTDSDIISASPLGAYGFEQHKVIDGDYFSYYKANKNTKQGDKIVVLTQEQICQQIDILQTTISGGELIAIISGKEVRLGTLDKYHNSFNLDSIKAIEKLIIVWKNETIPQINEILFR